MSLFLIGSLIIMIGLIIIFFTGELKESLILSIWGASLIIHDGITELKNTIINN